MRGMLPALSDVTLFENALQKSPPAILANCHTCTCSLRTRGPSFETVMSSRESGVLHLETWRAGIKVSD